MDYKGKVLTIAGSDSGGGAGIQADLKTFARMGVYGMSAITAVTAQNTTGVRSVHNLPAAMVGDQIDMVLEDIGADVVKTGMVSNVAIIEVVVDRLERHGIEQLVVDPVMVSAAGSRLLDKDAEAALIRGLLPGALVVTPNLYEAEIIVGHSINTLEEGEAAVKEIQATGPRYVLMKMGSVEQGKAVDLGYDGQNLKVFEAEKIETNSTHGTGCTLSAAIAAGIALGNTIPEAIHQAKRYVTEAVREAPKNIGQGFGPLNHNV